MPLGKATKRKTKPEPLRLRPADPGEEFILKLDRNPGGHSRPSKAVKGGTVRVPGLSINDWMGAPWRVRQNLRDELHRLVRQACILQNCPAFGEGRPQVQETYYFRDGRHRDWRNYDGKFPIDGLVAAGALPNDTDTAVEILRPLMVLGDPNPRVEIRLLDTRLKGGTA